MGITDCDISRFTRFESVNWFNRYFQFDVEDEDSSDNYNKNEDALHHSNHCEWDYVRFVFF